MFYKQCCKISVLLRYFMQYYYFYRYAQLFIVSIYCTQQAFYIDIKTHVKLSEPAICFFVAGQQNIENH